MSTGRYPEYNREGLTDEEAEARIRERGNAREAMASMVIYGADGKPVFVGDYLKPNAPSSPPTDAPDADNQ